MTYLHHCLSYLVINDKIIDELPYPSCGSVVKSRKTEQRKSTDGANVYFKRRNDEYFESC